MESVELDGGAGVSSLRCGEEAKLLRLRHYTHQKLMERQAVCLCKRS